MPGNRDPLTNWEHAIDRAEWYGIEQSLILGLYSVCSQVKMAKCEQELDEAMPLRNSRNLEIAIDQAECWGVACVEVCAAKRVLEEELHIKEVLVYFRDSLRRPYGP